MREQDLLVSESSSRRSDPRMPLMHYHESIIELEGEFSDASEKFSALKSQFKDSDQQGRIYIEDLEKTYLLSQSALEGAKGEFEMASIECLETEGDPVGESILLVLSMLEMFVEKLNQVNEYMLNKKEKVVHDCSEITNECVSSSTINFTQKTSNELIGSIKQLQETVQLRDETINALNIECEERSKLLYACSEEITQLSNKYDKMVEENKSLNDKLAVFLEKSADSGFSLDYGKDLKKQNEHVDPEAQESPGFNMEQRVQRRVSRKATNSTIGNVLHIFWMALEHKRALYGHTIQDSLDLFQSLDVDHSGYLSADEMKKGIHRLGLGLADKEVETLLNYMESRGNNEGIAYESFARALHRNRKLGIEDDVDSTRANSPKYNDHTVSSLLKSPSSNTLHDPMQSKVQIDRKKNGHFMVFGTSRKDDPSICNRSGIQSQRARQNLRTKLKEERKMLKYGRRVHATKKPPGHFSYILPGGGGTDPQNPLVKYNRQREKIPDFTSRKSIFAPEELAGAKSSLRKIDYKNLEAKTYKKRISIVVPKDLKEAKKKLRATPTPHPSKGKKTYLSGTSDIQTARRTLGQVDSAEQAFEWLENSGMKINNDQRRLMRSLGMNIGSSKESRHHEKRTTSPVHKIMRKTQTITVKETKASRLRRASTITREINKEKAATGWQKCLVRGR